MDILGKRLKELRLIKKLSQEKLGEYFNKNKNTISQYENGLRTPDLNLINDFANFFGVTTDYLFGRTNLKQELKINNLIKLPVIGIIRAGEPILAEQNIKGYEYIPENCCPSGECFFLKVTGDSMNLSRIKEDDLVLVKKQEEVENGETAIVLIDGENATIKRFYKTDTTVTLMPNSSNPEHQPRVIDLKNVNVKVIGKVIKAIINF